MKIGCLAMTPKMASGDRALLASYRIVEFDGELSTFFNQACLLILQQSCLG